MSTVVLANSSGPSEPASLQRTVYVLKNCDNPPRCYTGVTSNLGARIEAHNAGRCVHTAHRVVVDVIVKFADQLRALELEEYLKSGSGVEFARRHLRCAGR